ncbi:MAG: phosphoenolpyruvate carboxylase [Rudaea sp.]
MEELRQVEFLPHDGPLREDVRRLGAMVGDLLIEQEGRALFERVEALRRAAIQRRESSQRLETLSGQLVGLDPRLAHTLTRAFSTYFQVVNLAERVHRIRRHREYQMAKAGPQPDGLESAFAALRDAGVDAAELAQWLARLDVEPVFTAHPTEAVRRSLLEKEQEMTRCLIADFDTARPPVERAADLGRLRMALTAGWQTSEASAVRPSVQDELEHVGFYLTGPLYRVLPVFYESLRQAWQQVYGGPAPSSRVLRFASWVGGDMDGNPNVGADTIRSTLTAQRAQVLQHYVVDLGKLARLLSQTDSRVQVATALQSRIDDYSRLLPATAEAIRPRHRDMPYRCLLTLMRARVEATLNDASAGYAGVAEFESDLRLIIDSLDGHKGEHAGAFAVQRLLWRVRTFGFHLARLDVRQDARVHDDALALLLGDAQWAQRDASQRAGRLRGYASGTEKFALGDDAGVQALRDVFAELADARVRYGSDATGPYIISMARSAADVLAVLALARLGGLVDEQDRVPLDVAPLFETVDDLEHAADSLNSLLADPAYRKHLHARGDRQLVMLGYSDSSKDGGIVASRWVLQQAQTRLLDVARESGVALTFFHGRGGSTSRGGGSLVRALMTSPQGSVAGCLRLTEQGEVIHRKYGIRALALRSLEQMVGATLRASLRPPRDDARVSGWQEIMQAMAADSRQAYRELVGTKNFVAYFRTATPIDVIERMALGSRPARRRDMRGVQDLRAIPWVFAWTQCRCILTGWYGLGSAIERGIERFGENALAEMARDWPFFRALLDDVEMVLAKTDMAIAERFSRLSGEFHAPFFELLQREFRASVGGVLRLKGRNRLLADDPRLALSIRLRNPYVDPMSLMQVDLLQRWRDGGGEDDALLRALVATVNGVARGLQNTG